MQTKLIVIDNKVIGTTLADDINGYHMIDPPADFDGELRGIEYDPATDTAQYGLPAVKSRCIIAIKAQAAAAIDALAWRVERAKERDSLGLPGETIEQVMLEREALRRASNRCESEINAATTADGVRSVVFEVFPEDRATPQRVSNLKFIDRFSDAEMQALLVASEQHPAIKTAMLKWQAADGIVLTDPATQLGVQALEMMGLIGAGRAAEILVVGQ